MIRFAALIFVCCLGSSAHSATLVIDPATNVLLGATDVHVNGALYDVSFRDGSCNSLFDGCTTFTFTTEDAAQQASQALLDQVLVGEYANSPELVYGMSYQSIVVRGDIFTPYGPKSNDQVWLSNTLFWTFQDGIVVPDAYTGAELDTRGQTGWVYADWTPSQVPIPAAAWLFGSALLGLGVVKRKKA